MKSGPLVSLIVAAHNEARFVHAALESAHAQDYEPFEVVFVDDGSTDRTADIARSFPCRYLHQENRGLPAARNAGLSVARGELIAFLDADDTIPPDKLRIQARYLIEHVDVGCVLGRTEWTLEAGVTAELEPDPIYGDPGGIQLVTAMIRRSILDVVGGFDETYAYAEDRDLFVRLREHDVRIDVLSDCVLAKRLHGTNMTMNPPTTHPLLRSLREKLGRERRSASSARS